MTVIRFFLLTMLLILHACDNTNQPGSQEIAQEHPAPSAVKAKVIKAGLFKVIRSGGLVNSAQTSTGKAISKPVIQLVKVTDKIPLIKDAHMSLQYRIWNLPETPAYIKLKRVLKHPPMTLPDGTVSTGSEYMITGHVSIGQVIAYTGYGLNEEYEMLEGDWNFQIWYQGKKLIDHHFTTYQPDANERQALGEFSPPVTARQSSGIKTSETVDTKLNTKKTTQTAAKRTW